METFIKSLYPETYNKYNIISLSTIERLKIIIEEHTAPGEKTPILIFLGKYLYSENQFGVSTEVLLNKLKKRKSTLAIEFSVNITKMNIDKLEIPDDGNDLDLIAKIIEMDNLEKIVKEKYIDKFKIELRKIFSDDFPKKLVSNNHP